MTLPCCQPMQPGLGPVRLTATVGGMDADVEPTWMYLRRVAANHAGSGQPGG